MPRVSGFTLIELMVSVTLLLLLSGLLVAGYNNYNSAQVVVQTAATLKNNLRAVRTSATSGVKPEGCSELLGYEVDFPNAVAYTSGARCLSGGATAIVGTVTSYTLPVGVRFAVVPQSILFSSPDGGASDQIIELRGSNKSVKLSVSASGSVGEFIPTPTP